MKYVKWFDQQRMSDAALVGGKNASLGEMMAHLSDKGIVIPPGFAVTAQAYRHYLKENQLVEPIRHALQELSDMSDIARLESVGSEIRSLIESGTIPHDLVKEINLYYHELSLRCNKDDVAVAVRSSATAEDLPTASFAGQQETFLNVVGEQQLLDAYRKGIASLFTNRAIAYRAEHGFDHMSVAISIGVQKMVRSDLGASGVAFSLDTETGHDGFIIIESSYGLGDAIVQGLVNPDRVTVHKEILKEGFFAVVKKEIGEKAVKVIYSDDSKKQTKIVPVIAADQKEYSLTDQEFLTVARAVLVIEKYYSDVNGQWTPMDVEWVKDGQDGNIYIIQARPETVHAAGGKPTYTEYQLQHDVVDTMNAILAKGSCIGKRVATGTARVVIGVDEIHRVQEGDILVTDMTNPDWVPIMKKVAGIITNRGGRTCHAAIVSRELEIPAIVGAKDATQAITDGQQITLDCSRGTTGHIYEGTIPFLTKTYSLEDVPKISTDIMVNIANPDIAFASSFLPVSGVGLARMEFIIANHVQIHPLALLYPERVSDATMQETINQLTDGYTTKGDYFVDRLVEGIAVIASAFYPRPVMVRLSDMKTNEYRNLVGGTYFEPKEENPMLGLRGAIRYYQEPYSDAFKLESAAIKRVREDMGLSNIIIMVPFVRTTDEAEKVVQELEKNGLSRGSNGLEIIMMCEVPSNVFLIDSFCEYFDGFSIGSNDLTQLVLGADRDSALLASHFDERNEAVKIAMQLAIKGAHKHKKYIGLCGQAPSDFPDVAQFLMKQNIDSLSLNIDAVLPFLLQQSGEN